MHPEYNNDIREFLPREIHLQRMRASEQVGFDHIALLTALFILKELFMAEVYFPSVYDQECQSVRPKIFAQNSIRLGTVRPPVLNVQGPFVLILCMYYRHILWPIIGHV